MKNCFHKCFGAILKDMDLIYLTTIKKIVSFFPDDFMFISNDGYLFLHLSPAGVVQPDEQLYRPTFTVTQFCIFL